LPSSTSTLTEQIVPAAVDSMSRVMEVSTSASGALRVTCSNTLCSAAAMRSLRLRSEMSAMLPRNQVAVAARQVHQAHLADDLAARGIAVRPLKHRRIALERLLKYRRAPRCSDAPPSGCCGGLKLTGPTWRSRARSRPKSFCALSFASTKRPVSTSRTTIASGA